VGAVDAAVPCALMLNLATTMTATWQALSVVEPDVTVALAFFDGEEAMVTFTDDDSLYGSRKVAGDWASEDYTVDSYKRIFLMTAEQVPDNSPFCQNEAANFIDRMDLLLLLDLIGTPDPNFQNFVVTRLIAAI